MRKFQFIALLLAVSVAWQPSLACAACKVMFSKTGSFGGVAVGSSLSRLPQEVKPLRRCSSNLNCEFANRNGVRYLLSDGIVVREEVKVGNLHSGQKLPLALSKSDKLDAVVARLKVLISNIKFHKVERGDGSFVLSTDLCLRNEIDETYELFVIFNNVQKLDIIGSRMETEKD